MVEHAPATLAAVTNAPKPQSPELCEIWTWQGDTSILPHKFESVLNSAATEPDYVGFGKNIFQHEQLKKTYIDCPRFDPEGFFFITYRSNAIGLAQCLQAEDGSWEIPFLTAVPNHFGKGVEECLLQLCLSYLHGKGATNIKALRHPELAHGFG